MRETQTELHTSHDLLNLQCFTTTTKNTVNDGIAQSTARVPYLVTFQLDHNLDGDPPEDYCVKVW